MANDLGHLRERIVEHSAAIAAVQHALERLRNAGREPNDWELLGLVGALASISRGLYRYAMAQVEHALTPLAQRSKHPIKLDPGLEAFDLARLERALEYYRHNSVLPHPILGKIETR